MNARRRARDVGLYAVLAAALTIFALTTLYPYTPSRSIGGGSDPQIAAASLAPGTESLLKRTAEHLSRMQGGVSVGGFSPFKPPDDKYRRKIENSDYTPEEVNHWVKEINNFLRQMIDKNPGLTLEEILRRQGLTPDQINNFVTALRNVQATAEGMAGHGLSEATAETLKALMRTLGVSTW
jgi:hypothetical protein